MYINLHFHRHKRGEQYRLQKAKTKRLRQRTDYPAPASVQASEAKDARIGSESTHGIAVEQRRFLMGCLGMAVVLLAGLAAFGGFERTPIGCKESDLAPVASPAAADTATEEGPRTVYLTFDDGPSENTEKVLNILKEAGVPASFFVIAAENNEEHLPLLERTLAEGHCIGLHTCTHEYRKIYASAESYWTDIEALRQKLAPYCGEYEFTTLRFPGGSANTVSHKYGGSGVMETLIPQAIEKGYAVIDWNVTAEDSVGGDPSAHTIASRVIKGCKGQQSAIVLMHDSSTNAATVGALPTIIQWLQENDYTFDTVDHLPPSDKPIKK